MTCAEIPIELTNRGRKNLTEAERLKIVNMFREGASNSEISAELGRSLATIYRCLRKEGFTNPSRAPYASYLAGKKTSPVSLFVSEENSAVGGVVTPTPVPPSSLTLSQKVYQGKSCRYIIDFVEGTIKTEGSSTLEIYATFQDFVEIVDELQKLRDEGKVRGQLL